jgi:Homeodomain-like domain
VFAPAPSVSYTNMRSTAMHSPETRLRVAKLIAAGMADAEISRRTSVHRSTVSRWRRVGLPTRTPAEVADPDWRPANVVRYAYLLGLYLGDGCLSTGWSTPQLRVSLDATYPGIVDEAAAAITAVMTGVSVRRVRRSGMIELQAWGANWLVAFPQHGPGKKHLRKVELVDWQQAITRAHPRELLRGLIHSDGCRTVNRFAVDLPRGGRRTYAYARYFFSNLSQDIRAIFHRALRPARDPLDAVEPAQRLDLPPEERRAPRRFRRREDMRRRRCGWRDSNPHGTKPTAS